MFKQKILVSITLIAAFLAGSGVAGASGPIGFDLGGQTCDVVWGEELNPVIGTALGTTAAAVAESLAGGQTVGELANTTPEQLALQSAITTYRLEKIEEAAAGGTITAEQAAQLTKAVPLTVDHLMTNGGGPYWGLGMIGGRMWGHWSPQAADALNLTVEELAGRLSGGQSLGAIADEQGVGGESLVDMAVEKFEARLEAAVENGRITQSQVDRWSERLAKGAARLIYQTHPCL
ncbi:MAG: hypothetical protein QNJ45_04620 [Ardenticatenaceae bacterium]|nr:hypothetical protein [Ardenticatenaceae bacterium]